MSSTGASQGRSGFTLIELLLVIALTTSLLGGTIALLSIVRESNQQASQDLFQRTEIRRFADDIRRDFRLADSRSLADGELALSSTALGWEIAYRIESDLSVGRSVERLGDPTVSRDSYTIGKDAEIEVRWIDAINAVQWTITETDRPSQPIRIIASQRSAP